MGYSGSHCNESRGKWVWRRGKGRGRLWGYGCYFSRGGGPEIEEVIKYKEHKFHNIQEIKWWKIVEDDSHKMLKCDKLSTYYNI